MYRKGILLYTLHMSSSVFSPKILIVEDDSFLMSVYEKKFMQSGFQILKAVDGDAAMALLSRGEIPDIILLDIIMPHKNGFEVLDSLHQHADWQKIPVVIISNLGQESDRARGKELGAVEYLVKSDTSLEQIVERITQLVPKR